MYDGLESDSIVKRINNSNDDLVDAIRTLAAVNAVNTIINNTDTEFKNVSKQMNIKEYSEEVNKIKKILFKR